MKIYVTKHANKHGIMVYKDAEVINDDLVMLTPTVPLNGRQHWHKTLKAARDQLAATYPKRYVLTGQTRALA